MVLKLSVKNQILTNEQEINSVCLTRGYIQCIFDFSTDDWDDTTKTVVFRNSAIGQKYSVLLDKNMSCMVPWEALEDTGYVFFSVYGTKGTEYRITSSIESFYNDATVYGGKKTAPPTPDVYEQILQRMNEKVDDMKIVDDALQLLSDGHPVVRVRLQDIYMGREVEIKNDGSEIQWRYTNSNKWTTLIRLCDLKGPPGETPEFEIREGHLFAIYKNKKEG